MIFKTFISEELKTKTTYCLYGATSQAAEVHAILEPLDHSLPAEVQIEHLENTITDLFSSQFPESTVLAWKRYFLTDAANQFHLIKHSGDASVSIVQQPPLNGSKVSVWIYGIQHVTIEHTPDGAVCVKRPSYTHLFHTQLQTGEGDSYGQTVSIFKRYIDSLHNFGATLGSHCIRTWLYVHNIDVQYAGMVKGRKMIFHQENLVPETHYIASTGIEGRSVQPDMSVIMDAYAIPEVRNEQVSYLTGIGYLNPTYEYGVTFERGTVVCYGDRQHVFISGTASINDRGEIVHPQDIQKQTARALENIGALLGEAGCSMSDIAYMLVYLRDIADYKQAEAFLQSEYPHIPKILVLAQVCRPGWLIEIECMAIRAVSNDCFEKF